MGWAVLYIAFGIVALWLLGEVLLQYKARLRWRLLAFSGFLAVVLGVVLPNVPVIALGTLAFATGQTFVTLSFRRGFSTGWALGGQPGNSKRRRREGAEESGEMRPLDPVEESSEAGYDGPPSPPPAPPAAPGESGADGGGYDAWDYDPQTAHQGESAPQEQDPYAGHQAGAQSPETVYGDGYHEQQPYDAAGTGYDPAQHQPYGDPQQQPYAEPYAGAGATAAYETYGAPYGDPQQQQYAQQEYADQWQTAAADAYYQETPPGGVWVPQQRETAAPAPAQDSGYGYPPQQDTYPPQQHPGGYDPAADQGYYYNEQQQRY
ncbi:hypothetical protein ACFV0Z_25655 [Streptomyces xiamenensis]|uniref:hypothetical protein n=1 Tax=Streptomyces xiamenensis TaxID=408015 RepID=UPI0036CC438E